MTRPGSSRQSRSAGGGGGLRCRRSSTPAAQLPPRASQKFGVGVVTHHFRRYCRFNVVCREGGQKGKLLVVSLSREGACRPWWSLGKACGQSNVGIFRRKVLQSPAASVQMRCSLAGKFCREQAFRPVRDWRLGGCKSKRAPGPFGEWPCLRGGPLIWGARGPNSSTSHPRRKVALPGYLLIRPLPRHEGPCLHHLACPQHCLVSGPRQV